MSSVDALGALDLGERVWISVSVLRPRKSIFRRPTRSISFIAHWVMISSRLLL